VNDEDMKQVARQIQEAANKAQEAADRIEVAAFKITMLLENGYGGNGLRLIEALEDAKVNKPHNK